MDREKWNELLKIGLTEGEAKVYLSLVELGHSTVGPIVAKAKVAYSNVYDILQRLIDKGIVSFVVKSKTKYFQAANPSNLVLYLEKKENEIIKQKNALQNIIPELTRMQMLVKQPEAEVFIGKKGLRSAYERLIEGAGKHDEDLFTYIHDPAYAEEADTFYLSIRETLIKCKFRGVSDLNGKKSDFFKEISLLKNFNVKYVDFPIPGNIEVCKDKMLIVSWEKPIMGVLIQSQGMARFFRNYIESLWKAGKK